MLVLSRLSLSLFFSVCFDQYKSSVQLLQWSIPLSILTFFGVSTSGGGGEISSSLSWSAHDSGLTEVGSTHHNECRFPGGLLFEERRRQEVVVLATIG